MCSATSVQSPRVERRRRKSDIVVTWESSPDGRLLKDISPDVEQLLGYPVERWFEPNFWIQHVHPNDRSWVVGEFARGQRGEGPHILSYRFLDVTGAFVWILERVSFTKGVPTQGTMCLETNEQRLLEEVRETASRAQESLHRHLELRENLSRRLASEIHDNLGQTLAIAIRNAELARVEVEESCPTALTKVSKRLATLEAGLRDLSDRLRMISSSLRPPDFDHGFQAALQRHIAMVAESTGLKIHLDIDADACPSQMEEIHFFRIIQEAISNVIRHSAAAEVNVTLRINDESRILSISDNGVGLKAKKNGSVSEGIGLATITERVTLMRGKFNIRGRVGGGTVMEIILPPRAEV